MVLLFLLKKMHTWWAEDTSFKNIKHGSVIAKNKNENEEK